MRIEELGVSEELLIGRVGDVLLVLDDPVDLFRMDQRIRGGDILAVLAGGDFLGAELLERRDFLSNLLERLRRRDFLGRRVHALELAELLERLPVGVDFPARRF